MTKRDSLLSGVGGGLLFGVGIHVLVLSQESPALPAWFTVASAIGGGLVFAVAMGVAMYVGQLGPRWRHDRPAPGSGDQRATLRYRILGDGRPLSPSALRSSYVEALFCLGAGTLLSVGAAVTGRVWPTLAVGVGFLVVTVGRFAIARYRSVARPPYSTGLDHQGSHQ